MFAALHLAQPSVSAPAEGQSCNPLAVLEQNRDRQGSYLAEWARQFSPLVEQLSPQTVVCSLAGMTRLLGTPREIAGKMQVRASAEGLSLHIAIAANPETALLAAKNLPGITIIPPGQEAAVLGPLPVGVLPASEEFLETLERWGISTLASLAGLPQVGLVERFGAEGASMRRLALGESDRPLHLAEQPEDYTARLVLDHPVALLEPLLFAISSLLNDLLHKLRRHALATNRMTLTFALRTGATYVRALEFPLPVHDARVLLKQAQLDLEAHPPEASILSVEVQLHPLPPRVLQGDLFRPVAPEPDKLHVVLARIAALVGQEHVGSPRIPDTHRRDAYEIRPDALVTQVVESSQWGRPPGLRAVFRPRQQNRWAESRHPNELLHLSCRLFRPPIAARVRLRGERPEWLKSTNVDGAVIAAAGPWRTRGDWWTPAQWARDEWDIEVEDGAAYRIYRDLISSRWFIDCLYD